MIPLLLRHLLLGAVAALALGAGLASAEAVGEPALAGLPGEAGPAAVSTAPPATRIVDRLYEVLLEVMREADELGFEGRRERLEPVLADTYDFAFMAEKSAGRYWRTLDPAQRQVLVDSLTRLAVATYASRFSGYDGEQLETLGQADATHGTVLVKTRIVQADGEVVDLDYRLRPDVGEGWRVIDVFLDGTVSELALRRAEYTSKIKREGFDALILALDEKASDQGDDLTP